MMTRTWTGSMAAVGLAVMLIGAGGALAKHDGGDPGKGPKDKGGKHGDSGDTQDRKGRGDERRGERGRGGGKQGGPGAGSCEAASSAIQAFVDANCPCDGVDDGNGGTVAWKNHGQYVRCVAHASRDAARIAGVKRRCAKNLVPCAAKSTCGRKKGVACDLATTGICVDGTCTNDGASCLTDAECASMACTITSAERCANAGGVARTGSCCSASPSGAFLD